MDLVHYVFPHHITNVHRAHTSTEGFVNLGILQSITIMSQSQNSDFDDYDDDDYDAYYEQCDEDMDHCSADAFMSSSDRDLECFDFKSLNTEDVERLFNEDVAKLQSSLHVIILVSLLLACELCN